MEQHLLVDEIVAARLMARSNVNDVWLELAFRFYIDGRDVRYRKRMCLCRDCRFFAPIFGMTREIFGADELKQHLEAHVSIGDRVTDYAKSIESAANFFKETV